MEDNIADVVEAGANNGMANLLDLNLSNIKRKKARFGDKVFCFYGYISLLLTAVIR